MRYPGRTGTGTLSVLGGNISSLSFRIGTGRLGTRCVRALLDSVRTRYIRLGFSAYRKRIIRLTGLLMTCFRGGSCSIGGLGNSVGCSFFGGVLAHNGRGNSVMRATGSLVRTVRPLPFCHILGMGTLSLGGTNTCVSRRLNCTLT